MEEGHPSRMRVQTAPSLDTDTCTHTTGTHTKTHKTKKKDFVPIAHATRTHTHTHVNKQKQSEKKKKERERGSYARNTSRFCFFFIESGFWPFWRERFLPPPGELSSTVLVLSLFPLLLAVV